MKYLFKAPSKKMIAHLQRGRAIELSRTGQNICGIDDFKDTLPGLHNRRLVDIKMVVLDEKEILCVYITKLGIAFLEEYEAQQKTIERSNKSQVVSWLIVENVSTFFIRVLLPEKVKGK